MTHQCRSEATRHTSQALLAEPRRSSKEKLVDDSIQQNEMRQRGIPEAKGEYGTRQGNVNTAAEQTTLLGLVSNIEDNDADGKDDQNRLPTKNKETD